MDSQSSLVTTYLRTVEKRLIILHQECLDIGLVSAASILFKALTEIRDKNVTTD
jgi:hypothetical protein